MKAQIQSIGVFLPERRMANEEFTKFLDTSDRWILSNTGIKYRHIADDSQAASDLGYEAARQALKKADVNPLEVDLVLVATATPDFRGFPSTACIIQDKLGATGAGAFDISAACTGFIYGLETARTYIVSQAAEKVLVIGAEIYSRVLDWTDRNTCVLFGDGAGAALLSNGSADRGILDSVLGSDGSKSDVLKIPGGSRVPHYPYDGSEDMFLTMKGRPVYNFAIRVITEVVSLLLERNRLTFDDLAFIVPHQANIRIIQSAARRLKIPVEKFFTNIEEVANTSAASIPLALHDMLQDGKLERGDLIITVGFGGGLTYGGNLIRW